MSYINLLAVLLLLLCHYSVRVNGRCWVECPASERTKSEPKCLLKGDANDSICDISVSESDFTSLSITESSHVSLMVDLPRVIRLTVYNTFGNNLRLGASTYHESMTYLYVSAKTTYIRPDLFYLLPNLKYINLLSAELEYFPYFSRSNPFLTYIHIDFFSPNSPVKVLSRNCVSELRELQYLSISPFHVFYLTDETFSGLTALTYLDLVRFHTPNPVATFTPLSNLKELLYERSDLTDISFLKQTPSLYNLSSVHLYGNKMTSLQADTFSHYRYLTGLYLGSNELSRFEYNCFKGLRLKWLYMPTNQLRELNTTTFRGLESLAYIDISYNSISRLSSRMFEYLPNLNSILVHSLPLHCDCGLQWMSLVDLSLNSAYCATPPQYSGKKATDASIYVNCTQELSYQCFTRSVRCPTGSYCQDTLYSYKCVYEGDNFCFAKPLNQCVSIEQNDENIASIQF